MQKRWWLDSQPPSPSHILAEARLWDIWVLSPLAKNNGNPHLTLLTDGYNPLHPQAGGILPLPSPCYMNLLNSFPEIHNMYSVRREKKKRRQEEASLWLRVVVKEVTQPYFFHELTILQISTSSLVERVTY